MPPKRAAAAAVAAPVPLFADCVFSISGTTPALTQADILKIVLSPESGATVPATFTKKITHLITNHQEIQKSTTKVQKALAQGVSLVTLNWVIDSIAGKKRLDETPYKVAAATATSPAPVIATSAPSPSPAPAANGLKRKASKDEDDEEKETKAMVEKKIKTLTNKVDKAATKGTKAIKKPRVDPHCGLNGYEVYVDSDVAWDARLNQTNIGANNNKFYFIQVLANQARNSFACYARWGRVGAKGQSSTDVTSTLSSAQKIFESKFRDKTRNSWADRDNFAKVHGKSFSFSLSRLLFLPRGSI